jgi:iron(III) transport system substrate-binding protein
MSHGWQGWGPRRIAVGVLIPHFLIVVTLLSLGGCDSKDDRPTVVLYVSADQELARRVVREFEKQTGIRVDFVGDTEAKKTTGLVERLREERDNPQADVFWSSEIFLTIALADEGVFAPYESDLLADWPRQFRDDEHRWYGFAARARVIVYAPDRVPEAERPTTWIDLTRSLFENRVAIADPRFGTTGGHLGAMKAYWDRVAMPGYYEAFLIGLRDNGVLMLPSGNAGVVRAIIEGEADLGFTDTDDVWVFQAQGHDLGLVYPDHTSVEQSGNGTLLIPNSVSLVAGGPNPDAAGRLIEFLLSERVERMLAESDSHNIPLRPGLADDYPEYVVDDPLRVDYRAAAAERERAIRMAMKIFTEPEPEVITRDAP